MFSSSWRSNSSYYGAGSHKFQCLTITKLRAKVDLHQFNELTKNLKDPKLTIKSDEIINDDILIESFNCNICITIPIAPQACNLCDALFCKSCLQEHLHKTNNRERCPVCRQKFTPKDMNSNLKQLTVEKIQFKHKCVDDTKYLTPLEKFKLTPKYQEILAKQKKITEEQKDQDKKEEEDDIKSGTNLRQSKRVKKMQEKQQEKKEEQIKEEPKFEDQIMSYNEMIDHLANSCKANQIHICPLNCSNKEKMTPKGLKSHLVNDCPEIYLQCIDCEQKSKRTKFKRHTTKTCIKVLQSRYEEQENQIPTLKAELQKLKEEASQRREQESRRREQRASNNLRARF